DWGVEIFMDTFEVLGRYVQVPATSDPIDTTILPGDGLMIMYSVTDTEFEDNGNPCLSNPNAPGCTTKASALSQECLDALKAVGQSADAISRALAAQGTLQAAVSGTGISWQLVAAIGVIETGFQSMRQICPAGISWGSKDCSGAGVFQIDLFHH